MLRFVARRLLLLVPILLGLSILLFLWIRALPGGPAESLLGERATPEAIEQIERIYGLDQPIYVQYLRYLQKLVSGDLGTSIASRRPVTEEIGRRFPATIELAIAAMIFAVGPRRAAWLLRRQTLRKRRRPRQPRRLADRDLDSRLLPGHPAQVRLRRAARAGYRRSAGKTSSSMQTTRPASTCWTGSSRSTSRRPGMPPRI